MNALFKMLAVAFVILGLSFQASAKDKKKDKQKPRESQECHWVGEPRVDSCNGAQYVKGYAQCEAYIMTAYCNQRFQGDVNGCLYQDNSSATKDCFEDSIEPFDKKTRKAMKKKGRTSVVDGAFCVWDENSSFNELLVADCPIDGNPYTLRRAGCQVENQRYTPMLFCELADASHAATSCMKNEAKQITLACRREYLRSTSRSQSTGEKVNSQPGTVR